MTPMIRGSVMETRRRHGFDSHAARKVTVSSMVERERWGFRNPSPMDPLYWNTFAYVLTAFKARAHKSIECVSIWFHSISASIAPCHGAGPGSNPGGTANALLLQLVERTVLEVVESQFESERGHHIETHFKDRWVVLYCWSPKGGVVKEVCFNMALQNWWLQICLTIWASTEPFLPSC